MKILLTGVTGFLGSRVASVLREQGHQVGGLIRSGASLPPPLADLPFWVAEETGVGFREALTEFSPDVVVHLAAHYVAEHSPNDISAIVRANVEYGAHLLDAMQINGCNAIVYAGTSWQHYRDRDYCPANLYAATKQAFSTLAEYYLDAAGLRMLELHLYDTYGENDPRNKLLNILENSARTAQPLKMSPGEQRLHLVHVGDVARGFMMACRQVVDFVPGERRIYRLPSEQAVTLKELVSTFNNAADGKPVRVEWGGKPYRSRELFHPWDKAESLPGWRAEIGLEEGLARIRGVAGE